jgi:hypothetical protein
MSKLGISPILAMASDMVSNPPEPRVVVIKHKKRSKNGITHKQPKPGKNKPAKGYNPETKEWEK